MKKVKAYVSYFTSYLLNELNDYSNINKIILFGSAARGDTEKDSDVDIFIDIKKKSKKLQKGIEKIVNSFYNSREALLFKNKGIDNKINIIIGKLEEWKDLKDSIESQGIVLFGRYVSTNVKGRKFIIFMWDKVEINRGAFLNKLYGFKANSKRYRGVIDILGGKKLGKSSFMIPIENSKEVYELFKKYKVNASAIEVYV